MLLNPSKTVKIRWNPSNKEWYTNKGYKYTKYNDYFDVKIKDLTTTSKISINVKCDYCGKEYSTLFASYYKGRQRYPKDCCSHCTGKKTSEVSKERRANEAFSKLYRFCNEKNYKLITTKDEYENVKMKIEYICPLHGKVYGTLDNMIHGYGCTKCGREIFKYTMMKSCDEIEEYINSINGNVLLNKEDYIGVFEPNLKIRCKCGNIFTTSYSSYKHSTQSCRTCSYKQSKYERFIQSILDKNNIEYIEEKRFDDCRDKRSLPFDFYLPKFNLIIEYDGEGHFLESFYEKKYVPDTLKALKTTQYHDKIKDEYCRLHNINLLRIPYWEKDNVEKIILAELNKKQYKYVV